MSRATYTIESYTADGTHLDSDVWSSEKEAREMVDQDVDAAPGSFAVVYRVDDSTITEVYRKTY